jgi:hypothetical protein
MWNPTKGILFQDFETRLYEWSCIFVKRREVALGRIACRPFEPAPKEGKVPIHVYHDANSTLLQ